MTLTYLRKYPSDLALNAKNEAFSASGARSAIADQFIEDWTMRLDAIFNNNNKKKVNEQKFKTCAQNYFDRIDGVVIRKKMNYQQQLSRHVIRLSISRK